MRDLTADETKEVLRAQETGRLGVYDPEHHRVYIVPISYVYSDGVLYFHSAPGVKLELLHAQADSVCFQVDDIADIGDWKSVIAWGHFAEIEDPERRQSILRSFGPRLLRGPMRDHQNVGRGGILGAGESVYRIEIRELSGRADESGWMARQSN